LAGRGSLHGTSQRSFVSGVAAEDIIVILDFSDRDVDAWVPWPASGSWKELIDEADNASHPVQV
jgi:hypothetical protein